MKRDIKKLHRILTELGELCRKSKVINGNIEQSINWTDFTNQGELYRDYKYNFTEYTIKINATEN